MQTFRKQHGLKTSIGFITILIAAIGLFFVNQENINATPFTVGNSGFIRDNDNFIDQTFRDAGPSTGNIIRALYGSGGEGTAYTQNRPGRNGSQCDLTGMAVEYVGAGTGTIPLQLSGDTIYVLTGGDYINTGTINLSGCSTIVAQTGSYLYSTGYLVNGMIKANNKEHNITDNLNINGTGGGIVPPHTSNLYGIFFYQSDNNTINNIQSYNNNYGISLYQSTNNTINNTQTYNNNRGIYLVSSSNNNTINNTQTYNNAGNGIHLQSSSNNNTINNTQSYNNNYGIFLISSSNNNTINNTQIYNNDSHGIQLITSNNNTINNTQTYNNDYGIYYSNSSNNNTINNTQTYNNNYGIYLNLSTNNTINNSQSYNNSDRGIYLNLSTGNTINNTQTYNNNIYGIYLSSSTGKYYGNNYAFGNGINIQGAGSLSTGDAGDFPNLQRTTGTMSTVIPMSWNFLTNPINGSGSYMLNRLSPFSSLMGNQNRSGEILPIRYSYGGNILLQETGVVYSGITDLKYSDLPYDSGQYIGSDINAIMGSITGAIYTNTGIIYITLNSTIDTNYTLFSDFSGSSTTGILTANYTIYPGFQLSTGDGLKTILLQLYTGTNRATHYGLVTTLDTIMPIFTGITAGGGTITNGGYYNTTGVQFTGSDINLSGMLLNGSPYTGLRITGDNTYTFSISDLAGNSTGMTFTIDKTAPNFRINPGVTVASGGTFTGESFSIGYFDTNISGATLNTSSYISGTVYSIDNTYIFTVTDKANNITGITFTFVKILSGSLTITGIGTIMIPGVTFPLVYYSKGQAAIQIRANKAYAFVITGDIENINLYSGNNTANETQAFYPTLTTGDGTKGIYASFTNGSQLVSTYQIVMLDTTKPTVNLSSPSSGQTATGIFNLGRIGTDTGVGMSGFYYFISDNLTFTNITKNGFTASNSQTIYNYDIVISGTYYRYVQGIDMLGHTGNSETRSINYVADIDKEPDSFAFDRITNADLDETYTSDTITIAGITQYVPVLATIDNGVLYISGIIVGTTGYVKLGDEVKIEIISSNNYDDTVSSTLTIGNQEAKFRVTTKDSDDVEELSISTKLSIAIVFNTLLDLYEDNEGKQLEFMIILKNMIEDIIDDLEDDDSLSTSEKRKLAVLSYLYELTTDYIDDNDISDEDMHTAPNGKKYVIVYDEDKACYTSPTFLNPNKCFPTLSEVKNYININNLAWDHTVDTSRSTAAHVAPNGKTYRIQKTTHSSYFSYRFISPKYFNSLADIKNYININNPKGIGR